MSTIENMSGSQPEPIDFYDLASKFVEETSTSDQPHRLLKIWARRFPEYASDLAALAYARLMEPQGQSGQASEAEKAAVADSAARLLSKFNRVPPPIESLLSAAKEAGITPKSLSEHLGLDTVLLAKLEQRLLDVKSIPSLLIDKLAVALGRASTDVARYLSAPMRLASGASYRSKEPPTVVGVERQTFAEALLSSRSIASDDRAFWLAEVKNSEASQ